MKGSDSEEQEKKKVTKVTTFPVPFELGDIKASISISTNTPKQQSKEQLVNEVLKIHSQGDISKAAIYYQQFINQGYKDYRVFSNYGSILKDLGKLHEAEISTRKAIELKPDLAQIYSNLGNILRELGKLKEAERAQCKAIELDPHYPEAHSNLGNILKALDKLVEAELSTRKAIELKPDYADAHLNLGSILRDLGKLKEAELSTRKAIKLNPDVAMAYSNLGNILRDLGKLKEAELYQRKAIELNPEIAIVHLNLGDVLKELGKLKEAELSTRKAIELNPDCAEASWNLSLLELLQGDYKNGLENYEFRSKTKKPILPHGQPKIKQVKNQKLEKEEKLLVVSEQGLGDTLQYMRYIPYIRKLGFNVVFSAPEKLHSLIKVSGIDSDPLIPKQIDQVSEGQWIPLLSLPRYLKVTPKNPIITEPYISSINELKQKWKDILSNEKRPIVGINWQGNPELETNYQGRSIALEEFSILAIKNEINLLSLQKGFGSEQLDHCSIKNKFVECQRQINSTWDFLENAAIIENCDLIITCDTSIAHLAGGMGKKVWLLLRDIPYWTWGLKGDSTFWYPSMRLFRQKERHNWNEVMLRVSSKLRKEIEGKI